MARRNASKLMPIDRGTLERVAYIFGENSAAARALADMDRRIAAGETPACFMDEHDTLIVGPAAVGEENTPNG